MSGKYEDEVETAEWERMKQLGTAADDALALTERRVQVETMQIARVVGEHLAEQHGTS